MEYKNVTITDSKTSTSVTIPTSPVIENSTTAPVTGMVIKSDGAGGIVSNEILREVNCIFDNSDKTVYINLSTSNSSTTYTIYNLSAKTIVTYKAGEQTSSVSVPATDQIFVPGIFLYDKTTKRLFYIKDTNMIIPIVV